MKNLKYLFACIAAFFVVFILLNFVLISAIAPSSSMENTIYKDSILIGNKLKKSINRGDIIIFNSPDNNGVYVKRVLGLANDILEIKENSLYINEKRINEPYLKETTMEDFGPFIVPKNEYFVMGDNRNFSNDSRNWGTVSHNAIIASYIFSIKI